LNATVDGLNRQVAPRNSPTQARLTVSEKAFIGVNTMAVSPGLPWAIFSCGGLIAMVNISFATVTVTETGVEGRKLRFPE